MKGFLFIIVMGMILAILFYVLKILLKIFKGLDKKNSPEESENIIKIFDDKDNICEIENNKKFSTEDISSLDQGIRELLMRHKTVMTEFEHCASTYGKSSALMLFTMSYSPNITTDQFLENIYENKSKFV